MLRGSKFPAILVIKEWRGGRKIFEVVDGNHRLFAARRCGFLRIPVIYQVE
jgi:ParB-like chromosome segregation protein Spo0J